MLIPFQGPSLKATNRAEGCAYEELFELLDVLSTTAGSVISMGKQFIEERNEVVVHHFEAKVCEIIGEAPVLHRLVAYSILMYFTTLVSV